MPGPHNRAPALIERVTLRRVTPTLGFASVRLTGVNLMGLRVEERDGRLIVQPPETADAKGGRWPVYALQPETREAVEAALAIQWSRP